jgi:hypothetical protein
MTTTLSYTLETVAPTDPNFPIPPGYTADLYRQTFDFGRNWFYSPVSSSPNGGIVVTDLSSMAVIKTATLNEMYAGTPYGYPAGSPPSQTIYDLAAADDSDLYILMDNGIGGLVTGEFCRFTRVNPVTMKVTGEFYSSNSFPPPINCVMPSQPGSTVNMTATRTIVAYKTNGALDVGPQIMDGTGMAPIGMGPTPFYDGHQVYLTAGARHGDGSCDFVMVNPDYNGTSGNIQMWRIKVSNSLVITSTHTGTTNTLSFIPYTGHLYVAQVDYDTTNDAIIMLVTNSSVPTGPPVWVVSANYDGSINWQRGPYDDIGIPYSRGQSNLTGTTYTFGRSDMLNVLDTATGDTIFTGSINPEGTFAGSYYRVWDASRNAYWTYANSRGFIRINFHTDTQTLTDAELVFSDTPGFVDLSVVANRRRFIATSGTPAWMENNAAIAFAGQVPPVYLSVAGGLPNTFASNNGAGGPFAISNGPLTLAGGPGCSPYFITEAAGPTSKPQWRLSVSDDGSRTWSTLVKPRDIGATGQYKTRLRWLKMGHFRQRSIKLECTDPVRRNIIGIYLDDEQGMA